jgi:hypothetical protein
MLNPAFLAQPPATPSPLAQSALAQSALPLLDRSNHAPDYAGDRRGGQASDQGAGRDSEGGHNDRALNLNILIRETLEGELIARVLEFPEWVVQAPNRQEAIDKIQKLIYLKLQQEEIIPLKVDLLSLQPTLQPSIHRFAGIFKDDPDFEGIHQQILKEKETIG